MSALDPRLQGMLELEGKDFNRLFLGLGKWNSR